jgi:hypothetical protein
VNPAKRWQGFGKGKRLSVLHRVQSGSGARSASFLLDKLGAFAGVMELEREADHSTPFIVEVKNK